MHAPRSTPLENVSKVRNAASMRATQRTRYAVRGNGMPLYAVAALPGIKSVRKRRARNSPSAARQKARPASVYQHGSGSSSTR